MFLISGTHLVFKVDNVVLSYLPIVRPTIGICFFLFHRLYRVVIRIRNCKSTEAVVSYFCHDEGLCSEERIGTWLGSAVPELTGLAVHPEAFRMALNGRHPVTGATLTQGVPYQGTHRSGWDAVCGVDKSVSICGLCCEGTQSVNVRSALAASIEDSGRILELFADSQDEDSRKKGESSQRGLMMAVYTHQRSRYTDPHLHTHIVIINTTRNQSGEWNALDEHRIFANQKAIRFLWHRQLVQRLRQRGLKARIGLHNAARLDVPECICERLSKGHQAIMTARRSLPPPSSWPASKISKWDNYINDRIRPDKMPYELYQDLREMLTEREKEMVSQVYDDGSPLIEIERADPGELHRRFIRSVEKAQKPITEYYVAAAAAQFALNELEIDLNDILDALKYERNGPVSPSKAQGEALLQSQRKKAVRALSERQVKRRKSRSVPEQTPAIVTEVASDTTKRRRVRLG